MFELDDLMVPCSKQFKLSKYFIAKMYREWPSRITYVGIVITLILLTGTLKKNIARIAAGLFEFFVVILKTF